MPKKILYILNSCSMGGATISFLNLAKGIIERGYEIVVVTPEHNLDFEKRIYSIGGRCQVGRIVGSFYHKKSTSSKRALDVLRIPLSICRTYINKLFSILSLYSIVIKEKPTIIHTNVGVIQEGYLVAKLLGIPHVWHLREYQDLDFDLQVLPSKRSFCKKLRNSYVITITDDIRNYFNLYTSKNAKTIYNGILHKNAVNEVFPKKKFFLCASRISPEKGQEETIKVFSDFCNYIDGYKLVILGFGEEQYIEYLKCLAKQLGCAESIEWVGYTEHVTGYMKDAAALIVNSQFEGFGRMTAEACFCNSIVIGRNTGGTSEILKQTGGLLFNTREEFLQSMKEVVALSEQSYKERVNKSCYEAIRLFSIEGNVEQTYEFYEDIIKNN